MAHLLGVGSLSLVATGEASAIEILESPELRAKLDKAKKLLTELAEIGAVYIISAVAELPTISLEKRRRLKKVGPVGEKEKARLNSVLVELGELGSDVSVSLTKVGAEVPGLAKLAKLVPILTTLAELSFVSDCEDAQANQDATRNVFSSSPLSSVASSSVASSSLASSSVASRPTGMPLGMSSPRPLCLPLHPSISPVSAQEDPMEDQTHTAKVTLA